MAERKKYRVARPLWLDRQYEIGETVEMSAADAKPLLGTSLEELGAKAERSAPLNKAEPAPANKAELVADAKVARATRTKE